MGKLFIIRSLSVRRPQKLCSKHLKNCSNGLHIGLKYIRVCSKFCDIHLNGSDILSNSLDICLNSFALIRQLEVSILFICSKEENCSRGFSTDIQYSGWNVTIHISMTKLWDKWLTQLSF